MYELEGKYNKAVVFTDNVENTAISQIIQLLNQEFLKDTQIRIMPDVHAGKGIPIGTSIKLLGDKSSWKVAPDIVSGDIHCSMTAVKLKEKDIDLDQLESNSRSLIPTGFAYHKIPVARNLVDSLIKNLSFKLNSEYVDNSYGSFGTLGGGNHFMELSRDQDGYLWLTVHSGSRSFGGAVHKHHLNVAKMRPEFESKLEMDKIINKLKSQGRHKEIQTFIETFKSKNSQAKGIPYLNNGHLDDYINDLKLSSDFAQCSRMYMLETVAKSLGLTIIDSITSPHNYFDSDSGIIRKGATDASLGKPVIIPINMRDGIYIGIGKGNDEWNNSAPHGAGRIYSRSKAKEFITLEDFRESMVGIYSSNITQSNVDESPFAYKSADDIIPYLKDTVDITHHLKPIWSFKA